MPPIKCSHQHLSVTNKASPPFWTNLPSLEQRRARSADLCSSVDDETWCSCDQSGRTASTAASARAHCFYAWSSFVFLSQLNPAWPLPSPLTLPKVSEWCQRWALLNTMHAWWSNEVLRSSPDFLAPVVTDIFLFQILTSTRPTISL